MSDHNIVTVLRSYIDNNPVFRIAFKAAFKYAKSLNIEQLNDPRFGIETFDDYIDWYEQTLTWVPFEDKTGRFIYDQIVLFYFVIDLPPVKHFQTPILPDSHPPWRWLSQWLIDYAKSVGMWMNTSDSITQETLETFYNPLIQDDWHMKDYPVPEGGWKTFNDFFARNINPDVRPIDGSKDNKVIVQPADSVYGGCWPVDDLGYVTLKGLPWKISQLLADVETGINYGDHFNGGIFTHSFLAPNDYHRQHAPVSGTVVEARVIQGLCYLEVVVEDHPDKPGVKVCKPLRHISPAHGEFYSTGISAPDTPGYQFIQTRGLVIIDNPVLGLVAVLPVGMAQVSSVNLTVKPGDVVEKGDEIGYFHLGGSDCVMVFEKKANVEFTAKLNVHYNYGNKVAVANV
ncbi:phosphatidylserine decarboxylase-domain-containing protein [Abortiporus biennis]|nr:phosphatidylserine decarboxylase-domain-containing protein [Abortiporus biennis]